MSTVSLEATSSWITTDFGLGCNDWKRCEAMGSSNTLRRHMDEAAIERGVLVLGMHRSGTSVLARVVNLLGVPIGSKDDLMIESSPGNPKGHWESNSLTGLNEELLALAGGFWSAPPELEHGWCLSIPQDFRQRAIDTFRKVYSTRTWVWKDPRNCITLPFWLDALSSRPLCVVAVRDPLEVAHSLWRRDGYGATLSLALWERYVRDLLSNLSDLTVMFVPFDDLVEDPAAWCLRISSFLGTAGIATDPRSKQAVADFLDSPSGLGRRSREEDRLAMTLAPLYEVLRTLTGPHERFVMPSLPSETVWGNGILAEHRRSLSKLRELESEVADMRSSLISNKTRLASLEDEIASLLASRSFRWTAPLRAMTRLVKRSTGRTWSTRSR